MRPIPPRWMAAVTGGAALCACGIGAPTSEPEPRLPVVVSPIVGAVIRDSVRVRWDVPERPGQLSDERLAELRPRIARLVADPDTFRMGLTDSVFLGQRVRVLAVDSEGSVLGELRRYGFSLRNGLSITPSGAVRAQYFVAGTFTATLSRSRQPSLFSAVPAATVTVLVQDSVGRPAPVFARAGTVRLRGVVRDTAGTAMPGVPVFVARHGVRLAADTTDEFGRFALDSLPSGVLRVVARSFGQTPATAEVFTTPGTTFVRALQLGRLSATLEPVRTDGPRGTPHTLRPEH